MNLPGLALRNLVYHRRGNFALVLGMAVGTAVLTGALLVGDSLRGSLRDLTDRRLGWVEQALVSPRFLRAELADRRKLGVDHVCGAIVLQGSIGIAEGQKGSLEDAIPTRRLGKVNIFGVDDRFWLDAAVPGGLERGDSQGGDVLYLGTALAQELRLQARKGSVVLHIPRAGAVPRESLLGRRESSDVVDKATLDVTGVLDVNQFGDAFSLRPVTDPPRNVFVPLRWLQDRLGLKDQINAILVKGGTGDLEERLQEHFTLDDWGLELVESKRGYFSLESTQLVLPESVVQIGLDAAKTANLRAGQTLVYLANSISDGNESIPYSIVAALDPTLPPPLGPFLPSGVTSLANDEIILVDWDQLPLKVQPGASILLTYFTPEEVGEPEERTMDFRVRGVLPLKGVADDPQITPAFPGITDKLTLQSWNPPFPYFPGRIKPRDEAFWNKHRATPKAYVTLARGRQLWGSRFGSLTSIRLAPEHGGLDIARRDYERVLLRGLKPEQGGFVFRNLREEGRQASAGGTDFSVLFLLFSAFLIVAALLLVGLLFHLNLDRRAEEIGLLLAAGYRRLTLFFLLLGEGLLLSLLGGVLGALAGSFYAWGLLRFFQAVWPESGDTSFLRLHVTVPSLAIGFAASLLLSLLTLAWALRGLSRMAPSALLAGVSPSTQSFAPRTRRRWSIWIAGACAVIALAFTIAGNFFNDREAQAGTFFGSGGLLLIAALAALWGWMRRPSGRSAWRSFTLTGLSLRNDTRNPLRSLLTAGLLASASFLIVAVDLFRQQLGTDFLQKDSGSGGFALLGESEAPVYAKLDDKDGRRKLLRDFQEQLQQSGVAPEDAKQQVAEARTLLDPLEIYSFRVRAGDDASCLNLYKPDAQRLRLLGAPKGMRYRGGFRFADVLSANNEERMNPWLLLEQSLPDDKGVQVVPVIGEQNSVQWILKKGLGEDLDMTDEAGRPIKLRIVALLKESVFQNGLVMSWDNFREHFPSEEGTRFFLIDAHGEPLEPMQRVLETALRDQGLETLPTAWRLQSYLAVENMYLTTFQALGALGLLLGAVGLSVVLLRGVWERRGELALLRALGYSRAVLGRLLLMENGFLLLLGLGAGILSALVAVMPHVLENHTSIPWLRLPVLLGLVILVGLGSASAALAATLRAPLLPALRRE
jgi:hypothetical protein